MLAGRARSRTIPDGAPSMPAMHRRSAWSAAFSTSPSCSASTSSGGSSSTAASGRRRSNSVTLSNLAALDQVVAARRRSAERRRRRAARRARFRRRRVASAMTDTHRCSPARPFTSTARRHGGKPSRSSFAPTGIAILAKDASSRSGAAPTFVDADAPKGMMRIGAEGAPELARLEIRDTALREAIMARCPDLSGRQRGGQAGARRIVLWSLAAARLAGADGRLSGAARRRPARAVHSVRRGARGSARRSTSRCARSSATTSATAKPGTRRSPSSARADRRRRPAAAGRHRRAAIRDGERVALPGGHIYVFEGLLEGGRKSRRAGRRDRARARPRRRPRRAAKAAADRRKLVPARPALRRRDRRRRDRLRARRLLVDSRYSREAERAADAFSARR